MQKKRANVYSNLSVIGAKTVKMMIFLICADRRLDSVACVLVFHLIISSINRRSSRTANRYLIYQGFRLDRRRLRLPKQRFGLKHIIKTL